MSDVETRPRRSGSRPTNDYHETADPEGGRLLWGRLAVAGFALLLTFVLGRCSVDEGVPRPEFDQTAQRVQELQERNALLSAELAAAEAGEAGTAPDGEAAAPADGQSAQSDASPEGNPAAPAESQQSSPQSSGEASSGSGETYVVEPGDTLGGIAAEVYGDSSQYQRIAEANGIDSAAQLKVGSELRIPPAPDAD